MKKIILLIAVLSILIMAGSCKKKHHSYPKVPPPEWTVSDVGTYSSSMTIVVTVPEELMSEANEGTDQISAFIQGACRGVGTMVDAGSKGREFFIMVHADASENAMIAFKYYCAHQSRMYATGVFLPFKEDGTYGSVDGPVTLDLHPLK